MGWQTADQISPAGSLALGEFRVDHIIGGVAGGGSAIAVASSGSTGGSTICAGLLVHGGTGGIGPAGVVPGWPLIAAVSSFSTAA